MKPETTLTQVQIENFSINVVDHYEGCAMAIVFLKKIYGEEVTNLTKRRADFISLSKAGKSPWIIQFLLNTITKPYRISYISKLISENLDLIKDAALQLYIVKTIERLSYYSHEPTNDLYQSLGVDCGYLHGKRDEIKKSIKKLGSEPTVTHAIEFEELMAQSQFLKGIVNFIGDAEGNLTRSSVKFIQSLGEAKQWKLLRTSVVDYNKETLETSALTLIDYVGYFVKTN